MEKNPHFETRIENDQHSKKSSSAASAGATDCRKPGNCGDGIPDVLQSTILSSSLSIVQVDKLLKVLD